MQIKRSATAHWEGSGKTGNGTLSTQSTVLNSTQYSYNTRFEDGVGTNPEELVGAAHAGCFSLKLALILWEDCLEPC
jgi:osmotically inducible protein OsmC